MIDTALDDSALRECCAADAWVAAMLAGAPYADVDELVAASDAATAALDDDGLAQALAGHPRIGERSIGGDSNGDGTHDERTHGVRSLDGSAERTHDGTPDGSHGGRSAAWSAAEQSGVAGADVELRSALAEANAEYERRFGHVYLVCATGRSASELLAICRGRLANDPATERRVVVDELAKINRLRLAKLLRQRVEPVQRSERA